MVSNIKQDESALIAHFRNAFESPHIRSPVFQFLFGPRSNHKKYVAAPFFR
jgi:hypothetical protein